MTYDTLIVGAGPSGAYLAYLLAKDDQNVAVVDCMRFPREKLCGGFLTAKTLDMLPISFLGARHSDYPINSAHVYYKGDHAVSIKLLSRAIVTRRYAFDASLLSAARNKGAKAYLGAAITKVDFQRKEAYLSNGVTLKYKNMVGADGAHSIVRRLLHLPRNSMGFCMGAHIPWKQIKNPKALQQGGIEIHYGNFSKGYGWLFPSTDTVSVGVGNLVVGMTETQIIDCFNQFVIDQVSDYTSIARGAYIPSGDSVILGSSACEDTCLIGDAAGLIDAFTGEGLYLAFLSAKQAAKALASGNPLRQEYTRIMKPVIEQIKDTLQVRDTVYSPVILQTAISAFQCVPEYSSKFIDDTIINYTKTYSEAYEEFKQTLR